jgi:hypothetical protein
MSRSTLHSLIATTTALLSCTGTASELSTSVPLRDRGAETYYVEARIGSTASQDLLVDAGSGFLVISTATLAELKARDQAVHLRDVSGIMADGSTITVPIFRVATVQIGCCCNVAAVEAAVIPGNERQILGLSALRKIAPFAVSLDPPTLIMSQCADRDVATSEALSPLVDSVGAGP